MGFASARCWADDSVQQTGAYAAFTDAPRRVAAHLGARSLTSASASSSPKSSVLIFSGLPREFFMHPHLAAALLDLLNTYGPLKRYVPLVPHRRAIIVFEAAEAAAQAKAKLDHLPLPSVSGSATPSPTSHPSSPARVRGDMAQIRVYFGQPGDELVWAPLDEADPHLHVPRLEKNFIISPPGSPPVGWQPSMDPAPKKASAALADGLVAALTQLTQPHTHPETHAVDTLALQQRQAEPLAAAQPAAATAAASQGECGHALGGRQVVLRPDAGMPGLCLDLVADDTPREEGPTIAEARAAGAAQSTPALASAEPASESEAAPGSGLGSVGAARIHTPRPPLETLRD